MLLVIDGGHFVAGAVIDDESGLVAMCAPILRKWLLGKNLDAVQEVCRRKGWQIAAKF